MFKKGEDMKTVKADSEPEAWEKLAEKVGDTTGWELFAAQG
jgi:hypothetical protein